MRRVSLLAVVALVAACSADHSTLPNPLQVVTDSFRPVAGAADVPLDAEVRVRVGGAIDATTASGAFHLRTAEARVEAIVFVEGAGDTLVLVPKASLQPHTHYVASVDRTLLDRQHQPIAQAASWEFTTGAAPGSQHPAPALVGIEPSDKASDVSVRVRPELRFNEAMAGESLAAAVRLELLAGQPVEHSVEIAADSRGAAIVPARPLDVSTDYVVRVTTAAEASDGTRVAAERRWVFTTSADATHGAPLAVSATIPARDATEIQLRQTVSATFNRAVKPDSLTTSSFVLRAVDGAPVSAFLSWDAVSHTAVLVPSDPLQVSTRYEARIDGVLSDEGLALEAPVSWTFTTSADPERGERPRVVSSEPAANAAEVDRLAPIALVLSKVLDAGTLGPQTIQLAIGTTTVAATTSFDAAQKRLTVTPAEPLPYDAAVTLTLGDGVKDLEGLALVPFSLAFHTAPDRAPPQLLATVPADGAQSVAQNVTFVARFDEPVAASLSVSVGGTAIAGTTAIDAAAHTVTFTPAEPLPAQSDVVVQLTGVADLAGNAVPAIVVRFRTGGVLDTDPPQFAGLQAAQALDETRVRLTWTAATDAISPQFVYRVWVAAAPSIDFAQTPSFVTPHDATSFVVTGLRAATSYSFAVRAVDGAGNAESNTVVRSATTPDLTPPAFAGVDRVDPVAGQEALLVRWNAATDAVSAPAQISYRLYVADASLGESFAQPWVQTAAGATSIAITQLRAGVPLVGGKAYFVVVRAVDAAGNESQSLVERSAVVADVRPPVFSGQVRAQATGTSTVRVSWDAASDLVDLPAQLTYRVSLQKEGDSSFTVVPGDVVGATQKDVAGLLPDTVYRFQVQAIDRAGNAATNPTVASDRTFDGTAPVFSPNAQLTATSPATNRLDVTWSAATDNRTAQSALVYLVYVADSAAGLFSAQPQQTAPGATSLSLTNVAAGTWFVGVHARDEAGNEDSNTRSVQVAVADPPPTYALVSQRIFDGLGCRDCHSVDHASFLASYSVVTSPTNVHCGMRLVTPGDPANSFLYVKMGGVKGPQGFPEIPCGGQMPPQGATQAQIDLVRDWIQLGAPQ